MTRDFNVNYHVQVRLTEAGRDIYREVIADLQRSFPKLTGELYMPKEDAAGWSRWQMWDLMRTFGPHMRMGGDLPFETTMRIEFNEADQ